MGPVYLHWVVSENSICIGLCRTIESSRFHGQHFGVPYNTKMKRKRVCILIKRPALNWLVRVRLDLLLDFDLKYRARLTLSVIDCANDLCWPSKFGLYAKAKSVNNSDGHQSNVDWYKSQVRK